MQADEILGLIILAVALYLILQNADSANNILNALGNSYRDTIGALQGS
jgi:hypothetical protein